MPLWPSLSLLFFFFPFQDRPTNDLAERRATLFDLVDILGQLNRLWSFDKYSLGFFLPLLGSQEKAETGGCSLTLTGLCENVGLALPCGPPTVSTFLWPLRTSSCSLASLCCQPHCLAVVSYVPLKGTTFPFHGM